MLALLSLLLPVLQNLRFEVPQSWRWDIRALQTLFSGRALRRRAGPREPRRALTARSFPGEQHGPARRRDDEKDGQADEKIWPGFSLPTNAHRSRALT